MALEVYHEPSLFTKLQAFSESTPVTISKTLIAWSHDIKELYEDVEHARMYRDTVKEFLRRGGKVPCRTVIADLERAIKRLDVVLQPLVKGGFVREKLGEQAAMIKRVMTEKIPGGALMHRVLSGIFIDMPSKVKITSTDAGFAVAYPRWYREELSFHVKNLSIVVDKLLLYLNQPGDESACSLSEDVVGLLIPDIQELPDEKTLKGVAIKLWAWATNEVDADAAEAAPAVRAAERRSLYQQYGDLTPSQRLQIIKTYGISSPQQQKQANRRVMKGKIRKNRLKRFAELGAKARRTRAQEAQYDRLINRIYPDEE